jgi:hypothetical protein
MISSDIMVEKLAEKESKAEADKEAKQQRKKKAAENKAARAAVEAERLLLKAKILETEQPLREWAQKNNIDIIEGKKLTVSNLKAILNGLGGEAKGKTTREDFLSACIDALEDLVE